MPPESADGTGAASFISEYSGGNAWPINGVCGAVGERPIAAFGSASGKKIRGPLWI